MKDGRAKWRIRRIAKLNDILLLRVSFLPFVLLSSFSFRVFPFLALSELVTPVVRSSARLGTVMQIRNNLITPPRYRVHHYKINIPLQHNIRRLRRRYLRKKSHHSSSFQLGKCNLFRPSWSREITTFRESRFNINCSEFAEGAILNTHPTKTYLCIKI